LFSVVGALVPRKNLTYWERIKKLFTFYHPTDYVSWIDLPLEVRIAVAEVAIRVEDDGIDTTNIRLYFKDNPYVGTAYLADDVIVLDRDFLQPGNSNPMRFTLFHELRHFDQSRRGHVFFRPKGKTEWMGETYHQKPGDGHFLEPWELDANAYAEAKLTAEQLDFHLYHKMKFVCAKHGANMIVRY
jgi:hypothetical protein